MKAEVIGGLGSFDSKPMLSLCLRGKIWKYRGEGNANIVIALPQERLILRLHKWERGKEITPEIEYEEEQRILREVIFCRAVMVPLLGNAYIQPPKPARLENEVLVHLDMALRPLRPVYRTHKEIKFCFVAIYPDYALLPFGLKNIPDNFIDCNNYRTMPLQSIENQNHLFTEDILTRMLLKNVSLCSQKRNGVRYILDFDLEADNSRQDSTSDIVSVENNKNVNESLDSPLIINNTREQQSNNVFQHISPLYISAKSRGPRRFSTGSDFNVILPSLTTFADPSEVASSAPVYSQFVLESNANESPAVFCVEVKPKQGWIPLMDRINPKCTFCLNQYLKLSKGLIETMSQYCPLDLFSGDEIRMKNALRNLLATPQNNLKLFRNGVLVYSDNMSSDELFPILKEWLRPTKQSSSNDDLEKFIDKFCDLVLTALTTDLTGGEPLPSIEDVSSPECSAADENFKIVRDIWPSSPVIKSSTSLFDLSPACDWTSQQLPSNCILDRILKIQQLEQSGADAVFNIFKNLYPDENDYDYVNKLCNHPENILRLDPVQRYLLATTAKDCSILIAFQKINHQGHCNTKQTHTMKDIDGISYAWNVGISDLDPKPLSCIRKHRKRDSDVIFSYIEYFKNI